MFENVDEGHEEGEEKIVFRYNREERLKSAPQIVRDYYDGKLKPITGLKVLWQVKTNRFVLLSLIFFVGFIWIYNGINGGWRFGTINNVNYDLTTFSYEEEVYVSLKVFNKKADEKSPPVRVEAEFCFINNDNQIIEKKELFLIYRNGEEYLRTKVTDYDIIRVDVTVSSNDKKIELASAVKH